MDDGNVPCYGPGCSNSNRGGGTQPSQREGGNGAFIYADTIVEGTILLEIKAVRSLAPEHQAQVINYLKATQLDVGLLLNFGRPKLEFKRLHR